MIELIKTTLALVLFGLHDCVHYAITQFLG